MLSEPVCKNCAPPIFEGKPWGSLALFQVTRKNTNTYTQIGIFEYFEGKFFMAACKGDRDGGRCSIYGGRLSWTEGICLGVAVIGGGVALSH